MMRVFFGDNLAMGTLKARFGLIWTLDLDSLDLGSCGLIWIRHTCDGDG
jgi:hypothetical protein